MSYFNFFRAHDQFMPQHFRFRSGGFMMPRSGNVSITENINIKNGPSGFWGFMTGLSQGLFGGGMGYGMGMGSIFGCPSMPMMGMGMPIIGSPYAMLNGATTPQGTGEQKNTDLDNLNAFFGGKGYVIRQEKDGTYTAAKDGKIVASGKYDDVKAKLSELADGTTTDESADTPEAKAKTHKPPLTKDDDGKWKDANGNEYTWDSDNKCFHKAQATTDTDGSGKTEAQLQQEAAAAHDPKLELKNGKWVDSAGKEYEWKNGKFELKESTATEEVDPSRQGDGARRTDGSRRRSRTEQADRTEQVDDTHQPTPTKLPIHWNIRRKTSPLGGTIGFSGEAVIQFTDNQGKFHSFKAEKNGWHAMVGITEARFKAILADDLRAQLQSAGLADKYTI